MSGWERTGVARAAVALMLIIYIKKTTTAKQAHTCAAVKPHHKSRTTETGVAVAGIILDADPLDAGPGKALINVILAVKACPTCQEQKPAECNGEPRALPLPPSKVNIKHARRTFSRFFFFFWGVYRRWSPRQDKKRLLLKSRTPHTF